jgi:MFS family permease
MLARALIGLGVAVGLVAGLKAIVLWFPPERVALANGWYIMLGALGALSATGPAEILVQGVGWRGLFAVLAASTAAVALLILLVVPERKPAAAAASPPTISFFTIYRDARFWRIAPLAATGVGTSFSLQIEDDPAHRPRALRHRGLLEPALAELAEGPGLLEPALLALFLLGG